MAFRELHVIEIKEVLRLWTRGHGLRTIATRVGPDRKTVRRYIQAAEHAGLKLGMEVDDDTLAAVVLAVRPGGSAEVGPMREHLRAHSALIQGWGRPGLPRPKAGQAVAAADPSVRALADDAALPRR